MNVVDVLAIWLKPEYCLLSLFPSSFAHTYAVMFYDIIKL